MCSMKGGQKLSLNEKQNSLTNNFCSIIYIVMGRFVRAGSYLAELAKEMGAHYTDICAMQM